MSIARRFAIAALAAITMGAQSARADDQPKSLRALNECRAITDSSARLDCYDKATAAFDASIKAKDVVIIERAELQQKKRRGFGLPFSERTILGSAAEPEQKELTAKITGIALAGSFVRYTLESGAVWQTTEASSNEPKLGSMVTIKRGALGSFHLVFSNVPAVTAKRIY